jgi:hypothetical protein
MSVSRFAISNSHVECSSCLEIFIDPRILPCGHTFCLQCIIKQHCGTTGVVCALCRKPWRAPDDNINNLPKNYSLAAVAIEARKNEQTQGK